jgi:hypothetical protein
MKIVKFMNILIKGVLNKREINFINMSENVGKFIICLINSIFVKWMCWEAASAIGPYLSQEILSVSLRKHNTVPQFLKLWNCVMFSYSNSTMQNSRLIL